MPPIGRNAGRARLLGLGLAGVVSGCAASPLKDAARAEGAGDYKGALADYQRCTQTTGELDCYLAIAELHRPGGPLPDCGRFRAAAKEVRARYGLDDGFIGPHAEKHLSEAAREGSSVRSASDWVDRVEADCRERALGREELRDSRKQDVLAHPCAKRRKDPPDAVPEAELDGVLKSCDEFRRTRAGDTGIDRETDQLIADTLVFAALLGLDEEYVQACAAESLRPVCPSGEELRRRIRERLKRLIDRGDSVAQLRYSKIYLKRWPDGPDAKAMRLTRERATLDLALGEGDRTAALERFLGDYPESPLREEAYAALWRDAQAEDNEARYRELIDRYPDASFVDRAKARLGRKRGH